MTDSVDEDLHDVFRILYDDDDDWSMSDEDEHPPLDSLVPVIELDLSDPALSLSPDAYLTTTYSRKRFRAEIDNLIFPTSSKKRRIFPFQHSPRPSRYILSSTPQLPALPSPSSFEPFSPLALLARLRTFHPSTYSPSYPSSISATALASAGWINVGKDALECGSCGARWGVGGLGDILDHRIREEVGRRLAATMVGRHKEGCGWRVVVCPDDLVDRLRNALHPPLASNIANLAIRFTALFSTNSATLDALKLVSPLYPKQIHHLNSALTRALDLDTDQSPTTTINSVAAQLALFGWSPNDLSPDILSCRICQRRLGLWSFTSGPGRPLDVTGEHLAWCPIRANEWWTTCPLVNGGKANINELRVSQAVRRPRWLK